MASCLSFLTLLCYYFDLYHCVIVIKKSKDICNTSGSLILIELKEAIYEKF